MQPIVTGIPEQKAHKIIFPRVEFQEASLSDAVAYLKAKSRELDPEKQGVDIILHPSAGNGAKITLSLKEIPLSEVLGYISDLAGVKLRYESYAVTFRPE